MRGVLTVGLAAVLLTSTGVATKGKRPAPGCSITQSDGSLVTTVRRKVRGRSFQLVLTTAGELASPRAVSLVLSDGHQTLLQSQGNISAGGFTLTIQFGAAVRGIRSIELASADGRAVTGTIDGRALAPFAIGSDPSSLRFADGGTAPKVKLKPIIRRALLKLSKIDASACTSRTSGVTGSPRPLGLSKCDLCLDVCFLAYWGCHISAMTALAASEVVSVGAATPLCVPTYLLAVAGCHKAMFDCSGACTGGTDCCPVPCAEGHGVALSDTAHCDATCSDNAVCCGGANNPAGTCCDNSSDCCGATCLEGLFAWDRCVNPSTGAFCDGSDTGDVCGDTSQPGVAVCCPGSSPVCRDSTSHFCCPQGAGDVCLIHTVEPQCCPPDVPHCIRGDVCCAPQDICGNEGDCCPSPHICLDQTCCNPPSTVCGSACCDVLSSCIDAANSLCCSNLTSVICGSACCDGTTQRCVNGACCPLNSACGSVCCPPGQSCADPNSGTCSPCPQGQVACQVEGGPNICCGPGEHCCAGPPPMCCSDPSQQACCGNPVQCHSADFCIR